MSKYINHKKLLKEIDRRTKKMIPDQYDGKHYLSIEAVREIIANFDTVEAKPIIHAKWVENSYPSMLSKCSNCGFTCGATAFEYCPMCAAKMDGGEK